MTAKTISIIILNYNGEEMLPLCLPSIVEAARRSPLPCSVIVLDNLSTDRSLEIIKRDFNSVRIEKAAGNDFLFSYNDLIRELDSDIVILFNNDIKVNEDFIPPLLKYFEDENVFAVFPKQLSFDRKTCVRGPHKAWMDCGVFNLGRAHERGKEPDSARFTLYGFNGAFDRKKFLKLGGLDDLYRPFTWEDADICFRAWKKGWASIWEPASVIYHDESHTLDKESRTNKKLRSRRVITRRNSILFFWKNISDPGMIANFVVLTIPKLLASIFNDRAYIAAFFEALIHLPKAFTGRLKERPYRELADKKIFELVGSEKLDLDALKTKRRIGIVTTWYKRGVYYQSRFLADRLNEKNDVRIFAYKNMSEDRGHFKFTFSKEPGPQKIINWIRAGKLKAVFFPDRLEDEAVIDWCDQNDVATVMIVNYETIKTSSFHQYRKLSALLCPVKCTYDLLSGNGLKNIHFIRWGIDPAVYSPAKAQIIKPIRFIHNAGFGGASWRKNTEAAVAAFNRASQNNKDIRLVIKSQKPMKEYPDIVQKTVKSNPQMIINDSDITLAELLDLYRSCHVSLLPSKWEGIGLPFLESLSMGLPILTVDAPPMNEWVKNDQNGHCCKVASWQNMNDPELLIKAALVDIDDLASQIARFSDPKVIETMREGAIQSVRDSKGAFTGELNEFLDQLIKDRP